MTTATSTATTARPRARAGRRTGRTVPRAGIALGCAALGVGVTLKGAAVHLARSDPRAAELLAPYDARAAVAAAQARAAKGAAVASPGMRRLVAQALARDVTLTSATEIRALQAQAERDPAREARLFALSSEISRRSLPTRLWLIQRSVEKGDVAGALDDFDIALRTSTAAPDVLFPVLARAASDPALAAPIARVLDRPQDWRLVFLHYAITEAHAGPGVTAVLMRMRDRRAILEGQVDDALVGELVSEQAFGLARQVRLAFGPPPDTGLVADPRFAEPRQSYPFGWNLVDGGIAGAHRARLHGRPVLEYQTSPGGGGAVATQLLTLPAGDYRLTVTTAKPTRDSLSQPFWTVTCGGDAGRQIGLIDQPGTAGAAAALDFTVPPGCDGQWLMLTLRSSDDPDLTGSIASVEVTSRRAS